MSRIEELKDGLTYLDNAMGAMAFGEEPKINPSDSYINHVLTASWKAHQAKDQRYAYLSETYGNEEAEEVWASLWDIALISLGTNAYPERILAYVLRRFPELSQEVAEKLLTDVILMVAPIELFESCEEELRKLEAAA